MCCGPAPPAAPASSSARWTSSTSITSSIFAASPSRWNRSSPRTQWALQGSGEQGQPVEHEPARTDGLGQGPTLRRAGGRRGCRGPDRGGVPLLGRLRRAFEDRPRRRRRPSRNCCTPPEFPTRSSEMGRPVPETLPGAPATNSFSSSWPWKTRRLSRTPRRPSWSPRARTA